VIFGEKDKRASLEMGVWRWEFGVWSLEFGVWSLEMGVWSIILS
jgi:hypothetical protein